MRAVPLRTRNAPLKMAAVPLVFRVPVDFDCIAPRTYDVQTHTHTHTRSKQKPNGGLYERAQVSLNTHGQVIIARPL